MSSSQSSVNDSGELDFNIANYGYTPSLASGIVFLVAFALITSVQTVYLVRSRVWWLVVLILGGLCEIVGWVGRTRSALNVYSLNAFLIQQVCLVLAPCFYSATCYGLLGMVIKSVGRQYSLISPNLYLWTFCSADLVAIILQAVGGAMSASSLEGSGDSQLGSHIMLAGIVFQLAAMLVFVGLAVDVFLRLRKNRSVMSTPHAQAGKLKPLGWGIALATAAIIIRGGYRTAELSQGWGGYLLRQEAAFCVLDAAVMVCCQAVFCFVWPANPSAKKSQLSEESVATPTSYQSSLRPEKLAGQDSLDKVQTDRSGKPLVETV